MAHRCAPGSRVVARHPVGLRLVAIAHQPARLVRHGQRARRVSRARHGGPGLGALRSLYAEWPFFSAVLDTAEMVLAKADMSVAARYASLATSDGARDLWERIRTEYETAVEQILAVTGRARLLDNMPVLQRSIDLRNPYVDSLSELQVLLLARLRALPADDRRSARSFSASSI